MTTTVDLADVAHADTGRSYVRICLERVQHVMYPEVDWSMPLTNSVLVELSWSASFMTGKIRERR